MVPPAREAATPPASRPRSFPGAGVAAALGALAGAFLAGCARMEPPPGGPEDKVRPFVAAAWPGPGATQVPRELKARIGFSEWVNPDAARGKIWLSPPPPRRLKVEVKGNVLEVSSAGLLDSGTTYVLGVAGTVTDLHGLPLEAPFQLVFSTGATLDSGSLRGFLTAFPGAPPKPGSFAALFPEDAALRGRFGHLARIVPRPAPATGLGLPGRAGSLPAGAAPAAAAPDSVPGDSAALSALPPHPFRERPAYLAPADSTGRFEIRGAKPGRYLLLGFQDADGDAAPDPGSEPLALGPAVTVTADPGPAAALALAPYDTVPNRLAEARWVHEASLAGRSHGVLRLRFASPPHPLRALRRELYAVTGRAAPGASGAGPIPVLGVGLHPETGEVEVYTAPLTPDTGYRVRVGAVPDVYGNLPDTSRDEASFAVSPADTSRSAAAAAGAGAGAAAGAASASAAAESGPVFLGPRRITGAREKLLREGVFPAPGLVAWYPRVLTDSLLTALSASLEARVDTLPTALFLSRREFHELSVRIAPVPLRGQTLAIGPRLPKAPAAPAAPGAAPGAPLPGKAPIAPTPGAAPATPAVPATPATPAAPAGPPWPKATFTLADSARLGSLEFRQDASAYGSLLVLRALSAPAEFVRATPAREAFTVDSLPAGFYAVGYFRDADRDSLWSPGRAVPWTPQEPFVHLADSVEVRPGGVGPGGPSGARLAFPPDW